MRWSKLLLGALLAAFVLVGGFSVQHAHADGDGGDEAVMTDEDGGN